MPTCRLEPGDVASRERPGEDDGVMPRARIEASVKGGSNDDNKCENKPFLKFSRASEG
jgi:hypothetical protein